MYREKIVDIGTGEEIFREYTAEEIKKVEEAQIRIAAQLAAEAEKAATRQALLDRLGITEEEAKLLLG